MPRSEPIAAMAVTLKFAASGGVAFRTAEKVGMPRMTMLGDWRVRELHPFPTPAA